MTTNAQAIAALYDSKKSLQDQCDAASGQALKQLTLSIHNISSEIGGLEADALDDADYTPSTAEFKRETADAQAFLKTLNKLKQKYSTVSTVAKALDSVISLITKLGL
jgi:hypothetical protein